jgi:hypothetical protein
MDCSVCGAPGALVAGAVLVTLSETRECFAPKMDTHHQTSDEISSHVIVCSGSGFHFRIVSHGDSTTQSWRGQQHEARLDTHHRWGCYAIIMNLNTLQRVYPFYKDYFIG